MRDKLKKMAEGMAAPLAAPIGGVGRAIGKIKKPAAKPIGKKGLPKSAEERFNKLGGRMSEGGKYLGK